MNLITDLSKFGYRELDIAGKLLNALSNGETGVLFDSNKNTHIAFNSYSGKVFLTNDDCQILMLNDDGTLYDLIWLSYGGVEGSFDDLWEMALDGELYSDDVEYLLDIAHYFNVSDDDVRKLKGDNYDDVA